MADRLNGTVPLVVNLTASASGGSPASFTLAFGDGQTKEGTTLPATLAHTYSAAGSYKPLLTARYADGKTLSRDLSLAALPAPTAEAKGPVYNKTFTVTLPVPWAGGLATGVACIETGTPADAVTGAVAGSPAGAALCQEQQVRTAYKNGLNGTFVVGYKVTVPPGATQLQVEGGTHAAQTCTPSLPIFGVLACVPDMDLYAFDPTGTATHFATAADFESGVVLNPAAGEWTVILEYFAGAPNAAASVHILVA